MINIRIVKTVNLLVVGLFFAEDKSEKHKLYSYCHSEHSEESQMKYDLDSSVVPPSE